MTQYPEHERLRAVQERSQAIGEFLEWAEEEGMALCKQEHGEYYPVLVSTQKLLARFFDIDLTKLDDEKRAMLDELRAASRKQETLP